MTNNLNSHWHFQSIDGDNFVVDDNGFVLEAPDEQTGRELVRRWNGYRDLQEKYEQLREELRQTQERLYSSTR